MTGRGPQLARRNRTLGLLGLALIALGAAIAYVAYQANSGLPWQNRYEVIVEVPNANRLIDDAEVRIGGVQIGDVLGAVPERGTNGTPSHARLRLALDRSVGELPTDTAAEVRPASVLGLTFVDLTPGQSEKTIPDGGVLPLGQAAGPVDLTDLFDVFEDSAARDFRNAVQGLGDGFAGRGADLNQAIGSTSELLGRLERVSTALSASSTDLRGFLDSYASLVGSLGPVSDELAALVAGGARTFEALAGVRGQLGQAIDAAAPAAQSTTIAFDRAGPALDGLAELVVDLRPAGRDLRATLRDINSTLRAGEAPLRRLPSLSGDLREALVAVEGLAQDPNTDGSLRKLTDISVAGNETMKVLEPAQLRCNMLSSWGIDFSTVFGSIGVGDGPSLPNLVITTGGARKEPIQNAVPSENVGINPLPHQNARECESGNEPWNGEQQLNNPPGRQSREVRRTVPPPGVPGLAREAGLLDRIEGTP